MLKGICLSVAALFMCCSLALADLVENDDGTVTDTITGFIWQKAEAGAMTWEEALAYCENLDLAGHDDWRLPDRNELQSLVDYELFNPAINTWIFNGVLPEFYWSSTTYASRTEGAWVINFYDGHANGVLKTGSYSVRAVRSGNGQ